MRCGTMARLHNLGYPPESAAIPESAKNLPADKDHDICQAASGVSDRPLSRISLNAAAGIGRAK
jgi:hypothetical protein